MKARPFLMSTDVSYAFDSSRNRPRIESAMTPVATSDSPRLRRNSRRSPASNSSAPSFRTRGTGILIASALAGTLACGDSAGAPGAGGLPGTLEGPDVMLSAVTEDVYTVGEYMGDDWESFGRLADVGFDGAGNLHILDRQADRIVVLDPDGSFVRMVGGSGDGPGELRSPSSLNVQRDGGFVVADLTSIDVFAPGGQHLRRMPVNPITGSPFLYTKAFPDGSLVSIVIRSDSTAMARWRRGLPRPDPPGRPIEVFPIEHGKPEVLYTAWELPKEETRGAARPDGRLSAGRAFEPRLRFDPVSDGRLAVVDSIGYRIKLISREGEVVGTVERPIAPLAVTEAMREAQRDRYSAREVPSNVGIFRIQRESADRLSFADEVPVIADMAVDWEDRIWVARTGEDGVGRGPTDIVTTGGGYVGTLPADGVRIPSAFGPNGLMAYITTDEFGVQVVRVIRLTSLQPMGPEESQ